MDPTIQRIVPGALATPRVEPRQDRQGRGADFAEALAHEPEDPADPHEDEAAPGDRTVAAPDEFEAGRRLDITG